jgi:hypothetical protein
LQNGTAVRLSVLAVDFDPYHLGERSKVTLSATTGSDPFSGDGDILDRGQDDGTGSVRKRLRRKVAGAYRTT